jgi:16S rRNA (guanine527-N7)-methyltransferase
VPAFDAAAFRAAMADGLTGLAVLADSAAIDRLLAHARLLDERAAVMNLVGLSDRARWVDELYADSARLFPAIAGVKGSAVDIGSGAGFPGLVLAALEPERKWTLLDSHGKKCAFLEEAVAAMGLKNVTVARLRAEEFGRDGANREKHGVAVFKALARWSVGLELALPLLKIGGTAAFFAGKDPPEPAALARVAGKLGGGPARVEPYRLPGAEHDRHVIVIEKVAATPAHYPRRTGEPEKRPLEEMLKG